MEPTWSLAGQGRPSAFRVRIRSGIRRCSALRLLRCDHLQQPCASKPNSGGHLRSHRHRPRAHRRCFLRARCRFLPRADREEIDEQFPGQLDAGVWPEGWEPDEAVLQRVQQGLEGLRQRCGTGDVLVVAHGGVIYTLERNFGNEFKRISNLEGRWLHHDGTSWHLGERVALTRKLTPQKQDLIL